MKKLMADTWADFKVASPPLRHRLHYAWNQSALNKQFNKWVSSCACCCERCGN